MTKNVTNTICDKFYPNVTHVERRGSAENAGDAARAMAVIP